MKEWEEKDIRKSLLSNNELIEMRIQKLTIDNFRSYKDSVPIENLSEVNVFIGPNIAGKSNILQALQYLRGLAIGSGVEDFRNSVFDRNLDSNISMTLTVTLLPHERTEVINKLLDLSGTSVKNDLVRSSFLSVLSFRVVVKPKGVVEEEIRASKPSEGDFVLYKSTPKSATEGLRRLYVLDLDSYLSNIKTFEDSVFVNPPLRDLGDQNVSYQALDASKTTGTTRDLIDRLKELFRGFVIFPPVRQVTPNMQLGEEKALIPTGTNLVKFLNSLLSNDPDRFVALKDRATQIVPLIKAILAPARGNEATVDVREEGLKTPTNISNVSFGLTQILILTIGFVTASEGSVIMIEEPELHLHAGTQRRLFELIRNEAKAKQFFLTTHSPIFTGCDDKIKTYIVARKKGISSVRQVQEKAELKTVKSALGHRNTDLFGYECVIFVEGESEERFIPMLAEAMDYDFVENGIKIINVGGSGKATKIEEYLHYIKDSDVLPYVIADGNKEVRNRIEDWKREGILKQECSTIWPLEFEDCFDAETLGNAIKEYAKELSLDFEVPIQELTKAKADGKPVSKLIQRSLHAKELPELNKPLLAEKIALVLTDEMRNPSHRKTPLEIQVENVRRLVEARIVG